MRRAIDSHRRDEIDHITFVGQGEPLLCASLGELIQGVKAMTDIPVAVITNGSLLSDASVRQDLLAADIVMPSLDSADMATFRRINRPWASLRINEIVDGFAAFRREFRGDLWIEVMLVRGLNDGMARLESLRDALNRIEPDQIHLNVPTRPPAETWVRPSDHTSRECARQILGRVAHVVAPYEGLFDPGRDAQLVDALAQIIRRHPMSEAEFIRTVSQRHEAVTPREAMAELLGRGLAHRVQCRGRSFLTAARGREGEKQRENHPAGHRE
ncbi:radical SAM protein [Candidatus Poribacteria bacterium]|nr:radical SAM protein [Candidatus Poribacteria bacterium]